MDVVVVVVVVVAVYLYTINATRLSVGELVTVSWCDFSCCDAERSQQQWAWFSCWELSCCDGLAGWW